MSWDGYIDTMHSHAAGNMDTGAIIGMQGGRWTSETHEKALQMTPDEVANISKVMSSKSLEGFQANGVKVGNVKYQFLRSDNDGKLCLFKKKDHGGLTLESTKTAILIGHCPEGKQQGSVNKGMHIIAEYMEGAGY